eukprot:7239580-Pyramimonas_sp.AAC.1
MDQRAYSRGWNQSQGTREHIPGVGTNRKGLESIFQRGLDVLARTPIQRKCWATREMTEMPKTPPMWTRSRGDVPEEVLSYRSCAFGFT